MSEYIQKRLNGVLFSFYTKEEIRKLSVVEISNPMAFDKLNKPLKKGLYDPAMGISPYDKNSRCITCGLEGLNCTGHMGHIELAISIYNPLTMRYLHRILRAMCLNCHRIRIPKKRIDDFITMLLLIKLGYVNEKAMYQEAADIRIIKKKKDEKEHSEGEVKSTVSVSTKPSQNNSSNTSRKHSEMEDKELTCNNAIEATIEKKKELKKQLKKLVNVKENPNFEVTELNQAMVRATRDTIQDIWSSVLSQKCPHCGAKPGNVKMDSNTRFLIETKGDKEKVAKVLHTKKGYENLSDEEEIDEEEREAREQEKMAGIKGDSTQKMLNPLEVKEHIRLLWDNDRKLMNLIFGNLIVNSKTLEVTKKGYQIVANDWETFFLDVVPVTPNRFRPENKMGDMTFLHQHTVLYTNILEKNQEIKNILIKHKQSDKPDDKDKKKSKDNKDKEKEKDKDKDQKEGEPEIEYERTELTDTIRLWIQLQDAVNCLVDSSKALKLKDKEGTGIRQLLERKEGLFRMKMMGKRVNYSARSVISPDPYIDTNEVGVPMYVAKTLTFPEDVNQYNLEKLRRLIINGAHKWPGANYLEENGVKIALDTRTDAQREALAKTLMYNHKNKVVYRHLMSGDVMLFNRQPTLHKSSIMSHIARVLPKNNTIRNHYANCNTYNADFDGDEMNLHLLQNHLARAEAYTISNTANQYISPTHGRPLRGLIQDSIVSGFFLSIRDNFLERDEYQQLVYATVWNVISRKKKSKIFFMKPAIFKPKTLWTGKQVISSVLKTIIRAHNPTLNEENLGLNMNSKAKVKLEDVTKKRVLVEDKNKGLTQKIIFDEVAAEESTIIIRDNELLQGVIDKNQIGNSEFGLIHAFYEMYGGQVTETLLTCLARLLVVYLQFHGQTCGIDDLKMSVEFEKERRELIEHALREGLIAASNFADTKIEIPESMNLNNRSTFEFDEKGRYKSNVTKREPDVDYISVNNPIIKALQRKMIHEKNGFKDFDNAMKPVMGKQTSIINSAILPIGLEKQFPKNFFSVIVATGAKGSNVNQNQVSGLLSQQELEGRRVPVLPSGKTLPCFLPYDPNPRAWGYITDRFISGVRPQDFYFHCMAGREGLIDTAVKTSVSGYLQRCLVKNMETLIVNYDFTVRDSSDGSIVQFYYGEDALDPCKTKYFEKFDFIEQNMSGYIEKYNPSSFEGKLDQKAVKKFLKARKKQTPEEQEQETIMNKFLPGSYFGAVSENVLNNVTKYAKNNLKVDEEKDITERKFKSIVFMKYFNSLMHPGECVGALVALAIGEPSTQMTLNTFHLAGHGGANVTLGIPRLREILFKGPRKVKTPMMTITLKRDDGVELKKRDAELITRKLQKLKMKELIKAIQVKEIKHLVKDGKILPDHERKKVYDILIKFEDIHAIKYSFDLDMEKIEHKIRNLFVYNLLSRIGKELRKNKHSGSEIIMQKVKDNEEKKAAADTGDLDDNQSDEEEEKEDTKEKKKKKSAKEKDDLMEARLSQFREYFQSLSFEKQGNNPVVHIVVKVPLDSKKLLMVHIVENAINDVCISEIPGISNCHLSSQSKEIKGVKRDVHQIITEGVNFPAMWEFDFVEKNSIDCNDISEIYTIYGVEAARNSIIREIVRVFKPYGITVDPRHISLISDFITFGGRIRPLTREGMKESVSPLQKMSFEMASRFLTDAAMNCDYDALKTASAQIVLGKPPVLGTGMFDVMHKLENPVTEEQEQDAGVEEE